MDKHLDRVIIGDIISSDLTNVNSLWHNQVQVLAIGRCLDLSTNDSKG
jgi:hypothetical protein